MAVTTYHERRYEAAGTASCQNLRERKDQCPVFPLMLPTNSSSVSLLRLRQPPSHGKPRSRSRANQSLLSKLRRLLLVASPPDENRSDAKSDSDRHGSYRHLLDGCSDLPRTRRVCCQHREPKPSPSLCQSPAQAGKNRCHRCSNPDAVSRAAPASLVGSSSGDL